MSQPAVRHQPPSIRTAVRLMWFGAAVSVVQLVVWLARLDHLKASVRKQMNQNGHLYSQTTFGLRFGLSIVVGLVTGIAIVAVWAWMARKNDQGLTWARVVASCLTAYFAVASAFAFAFQNTTAIGKVETVVNVILGIAITVLLWRKESSEFYAANPKVAPAAAIDDAPPRV